MTDRVDSAVRHKGKTVRFVANGDKAAIFAKNGDIIQAFTVTEPATHRKLPRLQDENGNDVSFSRVAKPCSCVGGVWKQRISVLEAQL